MTAFDRFCLYGGALVAVWTFIVLMFVVTQQPPRHCRYLRPVDPPACCAGVTAAERGSEPPAYAYECAESAYPRPVAA